jgi:replication factor C subunit 1
VILSADDIFLKILWFWCSAITLLAVYTLESTMPSDIRAFFGGKLATKEAPAPEPEKSKKRGRSKKIIDDDEDEDERATKHSATSTKKKQKLEPEPVLEETTADDYFAKGKGQKPKRSEPVRPKVSESEPSVVRTPKKSAAKVNGAKATPTRSSARSKKTTNYIDLDPDDFPNDDLEEEADDIFKGNSKTGRRADDDYEEGTDAEDDLPVVSRKGASLHGRKPQSADEEEEHDDSNAKGKLRNGTGVKAGSKRKSVVEEDEEDEDDLEVVEVKPVKKRATPAKKATSSQVKSSTAPNGSAVQSILDSIPTVVAPPPPPKADGEDGKKKFQYGQHANSAAPPGAISSTDLPDGAENCLAGLTFVFTGQLQLLGRDQGQALVKQYGGKVTTAPSAKTSYVVLGSDAGPKKLETIQKNKLKTINEDGLFELIKRLPANGGDSAAAAKHAEKLAKEEEAARKAAEEIDEQERKRAAALAKSKPQPSQTASKGAGQSLQKEVPSAPAVDSRLWTVKYAPQSLSQICGNKTQIEKLQRWLRAFPINQRKGFKVAGADGSGSHRAIMIHGPPGIGKTTAAHLVAKLEGYDIVESNASDTRSKKLVETGLKGVLSTTSLMGYFGTGSGEVDASKKKLVLIMDEVDGMSAGDRGGVGALAAVCKKSQIPMILICNDRKLPKMRPFDFVTYDLPFRRPTTEQIRGRITTIAFREGLKLPGPVINALIEGTGADIRQVVNMVSTAKLDDAAMTYEDSKDMSKAWEKHIILKPWDMVGKILGGGLFNPASKSTLNDKTELYFNDHEFAPLMMQENYLGTNPVRSNQYNGDPKRKRLAELNLASRAADSISDGDLVDRMIHGSQQQWSLMPVHAIFSFVRPASYVYGSMAGHQTRFTAWLGKNSNQGKLMRFIKEIQGHMRLRVTADRHEIRQTYMPMLFDKLIKRLERGGKEMVPEIIELMDHYYLTKDDWDAILELGVGQADMDSVKIETQAKATFTRL